MFFEPQPKGWSISPEYDHLDGQYRRNIQQDAISKYYRPTILYRCSLLPRDVWRHECNRKNDAQIRYILKWETLNRNQDKPREKPWPEASNLYVYLVKQISTQHK